MVSHLPSLGCFSLILSYSSSNIHYLTRQLCKCPHEDSRSNAYCMASMPCQLWQCSVILSSRKCLWTRESGITLHHARRPRKQLEFLVDPSCARRQLAILASSSAQPRIHWKHALDKAGTSQFSATQPTTVSGDPLSTVRRAEFFLWDSG